MDCLCYFLDGVLCRTKLFMKFNSSILSFVTCDFDVISKKQLPKPRSKTLQLCFFPKCFIVPGLIIWSLVHFELIFTYLVDNLTFLFCKLPFVPHVFFSNQVFFPSYFKMLFALYFCHSCCRYFSYYIVQG